MIATIVVLAVALLGPFVLTNWHVSPPAIAITCGIILFYQALRITAQTPPAAGVNRPADQPATGLAGDRGLSDSVPAIVTAPGIAAIAVITVLDRPSTISLIRRLLLHC